MDLSSGSHLVTGKGITMSEALGMGGETVVIGLGIVFAVLAILMIVLYIFGVIFNKKPKADPTPQKAEERNNRLLEIFYNELGGMEFLSSDDWKTNYPGGKRYWQCYKERWNNIHYEIVPVAESSKYYLSADGKFRVELHVEGRNRSAITSRLKTPAKAEIDGAVQRDTENDRRAVISFEFKEDFSSREKMNDSIKKIKAAFEWLDRTYTSQIDAITRRDSNE